jgi:hypothetical protein
MTMMKRTLAVGVVAVLLGLAAPKPAAAHVNFSFAIGVPGFYGAVGAPAPVVVPEPAFVPAPVVVPAPAYYPAPYPVVYYHHYYGPRFRRFGHHPWHGRWH